MEGVSEKFNRPFPMPKKLLTLKEVEYILKGRKEGVDRNKDMRIRRKAINELYDLTFLAENIDFAQFRKIFTPENLVRLIKRICERIVKADWGEKWVYKDGKFPEEVIADREIFTALIYISMQCLWAASQLIDPEFKVLLNETAKLKVFPDRNIITFMTTAFQFLRGFKYNTL